MSLYQQKDKFKVLKSHEKYFIKFKSIMKINKNAKLTFEDLSLAEFQQGDIANCGLIATLAAISQRPEFYTEISPKVEQTSESIKFRFNMFYKGKPVTVRIDDKLPFVGNLSDDKFSLIYARSAENDNSYLASFFEKAFVKQACFKSYDHSVGIDPLFVFSVFSDCLTSCSAWFESDSKHNVLDILKFEVDNGSSIVMSIRPDLNYKLGDTFEAGHAYAVMDYNLEHKAIKLYNPNVFTKHCYKNLPLSFTEKADQNKGELWINLDQLKNRIVFIDSLCSKNMYKSIFQVNKIFKPINTDKHYSIVKYACKVDIKQASMFIISLFSYVHKIEDFLLSVCTVDNERQNVELEDEIPRLDLYNENQNKGEAKFRCHRRFRLKPNKYVFHFEVKINEVNLKYVYLLLKIGSVSECFFEEIKKEN